MKNEITEYSNYEYVYTMKPRERAKRAKRGGTFRPIEMEREPSAWSAIMMAAKRTLSGIRTLLGKIDSVIVVTVLLCVVVPGTILWCTFSPVSVFDIFGSFDTYQVCSKYYGNTCDLLSADEWRHESHMNRNTFYNRKDPRKVRNYQYHTVHRINLSDYSK